LDTLSYFIPFTNFLLHSEPWERRLIMFEVSDMYHVKWGLYLVDMNQKKFS